MRLIAIAVAIAFLAIRSRQDARLMEEVCEG
jgi:hypothetical protein